METPLINYATIFTAVVTQVTDAIAAIVPVALPIVGISAAIGFGVKLFRRLAK